MRPVAEIAVRQIYSPYRRSFSSLASILAIVGLGLGIASLLLTFSILQGFENTLSNKIAGFDGHLRIEHFMGYDIEQSDPVLDSLFSEVAFYPKRIPFIQKQALLRKGQYAEGLLVEAIPDSCIDEIALLADLGPQIHTSNWIILGNRLADLLDIEPGDNVVLFDMETFRNPLGQSRLKQFEVKGFFHSGLFEYDKTVAYISIDNAQKLFNMGGRISGNKLIFNDPDEAGTLYSFLNDRLPYPYYVMTWKEKHQILFQWMETQKLPILIIFGLITLVGIVNILAALTMIVIEKVRGIGILRSLGMTRKSITNIFIIDGMIIGAAGSLLGIFLAVLLAFLQGRYQLITIPEDIYFMDQVPFYFTLRIFAFHFLASIVISVVAAVAPAMKAARIHPAEAVRYE